MNTEDPRSIPGSGRPSVGGHGNPLQYSCLENSIDRGAWWATVHGVAESDTNEWLTLSVFFVMKVGESCHSYIGWMKSACCTESEHFTAKSPWRWQRPGSSLDLRTRVQAPWALVHDLPVGEESSFNCVHTSPELHFYVTAQLSVPILSEISLSWGFKSMGPWPPNILQNAWEKANYFPTSLVTGTLACLGESLRHTDNNTCIKMQNHPSVTNKQYRMKLQENREVASSVLIFQTLCNFSQTLCFFLKDTFSYHRRNTGLLPPLLIFHLYNWLLGWMQGRPG